MDNDNMPADDNCPGINVILATPNTKPRQFENEDELSRSKEDLAETVNEFVKDEIKTGAGSIAEAVNDLSDKDHKEFIDNHEGFAKTSDDLANSNGGGVESVTNAIDKQLSFNNGDESKSPVAPSVDSLVEAVNDFSDKVGNEIAQGTEDAAEPTKNLIGATDISVDSVIKDTEQMGLNDVDDLKVSIKWVTSLCFIS